jgi:hypothetical protein
MVEHESLRHFPERTPMTRTPNYVRQIEAAIEPILDRLVGSPTIPETKRYVIKLRAVASALRDEAAAIDQLADETAAGLENWEVSVDSGRSLSML